MYDLTASEQANRTALLLVNERYNNQLAPFVQGKKSRFTYVENHLKEIIQSACDEVAADVDEVTARFAAHLAVLDAVLKNPGDVKREQLTNPNRDEPYAGNLNPNSQEGREGIVDADVLDRGEIPGASRDDAVEPDARVDLSQETADPNGPTEVPGLVSSCVRCGEQRTSNISPVCATCNSELLKLAYGTDTAESLGEGAGAPAPGVQEAPAVNPNLPYACTLCGREGNADEIRMHIQRDHADVLQRQQEQSTQNMGQDNLGVPQSLSKWKMADVPDLSQYQHNPDALAEALRRAQAGDEQSKSIIRHAMDDPRVFGYLAQIAGGGYVLYESLRHIFGKIADVPNRDDGAKIEPLPQNPGDRFDDYVQRLAETAAARKFSQPSDEDLHSIASQVGASPDDVKNGLVTVAVFGDNVAVNGQLGGDPSPPEGYEEISAQGLSGQQPTHDALVPTDLIITTVANDMNMSRDLAYQQVKDKYGADLPETYHASISGQVHYYLPSGLAGNQPPQQDETGPAAPPAPQAQPAQMPTGQPTAPTM